MGMAFASTLGEGETFTTLEIKVNYLRPVFEEKLFASAKVVHRGRTVGLVECDVTTENGKLVARAVSTCSVSGERKRREVRDGRLRGLIARYGLTAVFLFTFLENIGLPIPAFPVLMLAGAYASTRHAALLMVLVAAVGGALLADAICTRSADGRERVLTHLCRVSFNPTPAWSGPSTDFTAGWRRRSSSRSSSGREHDRAAAGGVSAVPISVFLLLDLAGAALWAGAAVALGFAFGERIAETARGVQGMMGNSSLPVSP